MLHRPIERTSAAFTNPAPKGSDPASVNTPALHRSNQSDGNPAEHAAKRTGTQTASLLRKGTSLSRQVDIVSVSAATGSATRPVVLREGEGSGKGRRRAECVRRPQAPRTGRTRHRGSVPSGASGAIAATGGLSLPKTSSGWFGSPIARAWSRRPMSCVSISGVKSMRAGVRRTCLRPPRQRARSSRGNRP